MSRTLLILISLYLALSLASCQGRIPAAQPGATTPPTIAGEAGPSTRAGSSTRAGLIVEGKLVPKEYVNLSFNIPGTVAELPVQESQSVQAGELIARLDQRERLAAAVTSAELELINARQALKALNENAEVNTAAALQKVASARDAVRYAERYLNNLKTGSRQTDIDSAKADVVILKDRLEQARKDFNAVQNKPEDNLTRATYLSKLADAQRKYDNAVRLLNNLQGSPSEIDLAIAEANLSLAQARLALAEQEYEDVKTGPDPDQLEAAQARLKAAESAYAAAQAALSGADLVAPFSGVIVKLDLKLGEQVVPGRVAVVLADFSRWYVETKDLNEMEVPQVQVGQSVTITPDALPELQLQGAVESISQIYEEKYGDVTYTAHIRLEDSDPRLRWGMTVAVHFTP